MISRISTNSSSLLVPLIWLTDAKITTVITTRYLFDSEVGGTDIDVDTDNGVVTLKGTVESDAEKQLAMEIAKNAEDVRKVVDELTVIAE